jgi:hypothetical protein
MYDPTIGQFISEDPLGFEAGDANVRRYVENAVTTSTDPSGLVIKKSTADGSMVHWDKGIQKSEKEKVQGRRDLLATIDQLKRRGGMAGKLAWILTDGDRKVAIWIRENKSTTAYHTKLGNETTLQLWPFTKDYVPAELHRLVPAEVRGINKEVVICHELGHGLFGLLDPLNVALVENVVRGEFKNIPPRTSYTGSRFHPFPKNKETTSTRW